VCMCMYVCVYVCMYVYVCDGQGKKDGVRELSRSVERECVCLWVRERNGEREGGKEKVCMYVCMHS